MEKKSRETRAVDVTPKKQELSRARKAFTVTFKPKKQALLEAMQRESGEALSEILDEIISFYIQAKADKLCRMAQKKS